MLLTAPFEKMKNRVLQKHAAYLARPNHGVGTPAIGVPAGGLGPELRHWHNKFAACIGFGRHDDVDVDLPAWS
jgi:hypothetical protein